MQEDLQELINVLLDVALIALVVTGVYGYACFKADTVKPDNDNDQNETI